MSTISQLYLSLENLFYQLPPLKEILIGHEIVCAADGCQSRTFSQQTNGRESFGGTASNLRMVDPILAQRNASLILFHFFRSLDRVEIYRQHLVSVPVLAILFVPEERPHIASRGRESHGCWNHHRPPHHWVP
jgi:hypothetical protein